MSKVYNRSGKTLIVDRVIERGVHGQNPIAPVMSMINVAMSQKQIDDLEKNVEGMIHFGVSPSEKASLYALWTDVQSSYQNICETFDGNEDFADWSTYDDLKDSYATLTPLIEEVLVNMDETSWTINMEPVAEALGDCLELLNKCNNAYQGALEFNKRYDISIEGDRTINTSRTLYVKIFDNTSKQFLQQPFGFRLRYYRSSDGQEIPQGTLSSDPSPTFDISDMNGELSCEFYVEMSHTWTEGFSTRKVLFFTLTVGELKQYQWSNAESESSLDKSDASWSNSRPTQPVDKNYMWIRTSSDNGVTWTYARETGLVGKTGWSSYRIPLYKRSTTPLTEGFDGSYSIEYTFSTNAIDGSTGTWSQSVPAGEGTIYVIFATAFSQEDTDTIYSNEWTEPAVLATDATQGPPGINAATVFIYMRSNNWAEVEPPEQNATFNFETGAISGISPWSATIPDGNEICYICMATVTSSNKSVVITPDKWSSPVIFIKNPDITDLSLFANKTAFRYYADNVPANTSDAIQITVSRENIEGQIVVKWNSGEQEKTHTVPVTELGATFTIPIADLTACEDSMTVKATCGVYAKAITIFKQYEPGSLELIVSKDYFQFYADNYPHDDDDSITATVVASGYSVEPTLKLDGQSVTIGEEGTYVLPVSSLQDKSYATLTASIGSYISKSVTIRKVLDVGSFQMMLSGNQFLYHADNYPANDSDKITVTLSVSGYKSSPVLKVNNSPVTLSETLTYDISTIELLEYESINVEATCYDIKRESTISKVRNLAFVSLGLSSSYFDYYADNVPVENQSDITISVAYSGLHYGVELYAGSTKLELDENNQATVSADVFPDNADTIQIKVNAVKLPTTVTDSVIIRKNFLTPQLYVQTDAQQFVFDGKGMPSPMVINVSYSLTGVSSSTKPTITVNGDKKEWNNNVYTIYAVEISDVSHVSVIVQVEEFNLRRDIIIGKVTSAVDGTLPIYQYQYGSSKTEPPKDIFLSWKDFLLTYKDYKITWEAAGDWENSIMPPAPEGKPYLWVRVSTDNGKTWIYYCSTIDGAQGPAGKDGQAGVYLGMHTSAPEERPDGTKLITGDFYLDTSDTKNPLPYILQENGVWRLVTASDPQWSQIAAATQGDVASLGSISTTNSYYGYFQLLAAVQARFRTVYTGEMIIEENGRIVSRSNLNTGGVEGFEINDDGIFANSGNWNAGINSGTLRCIPNSKLPDGRDAFDFRTDTTLGEYWERFKALKVNTNIFLHTPENFRDWYRGIKNGKFEAQVEEMTGEWYGVREVSKQYSKDDYLWSEGAGKFCNQVAIINKNYSLMARSNAAGFLGLENKLFLFPINGAYMNSYQEITEAIEEDEDSVYGMKIWSNSSFFDSSIPDPKPYELFMGCMVDEIIGKVYLFFSQYKFNTSNDIVSSELIVRSFPVQDEYTEPPVFNVENFSSSYPRDYSSNINIANFDRICDMYFSDFVMSNKIYGSNGVSAIYFWNFQIEDENAINTGNPFYNDSYVDYLCIRKIDFNNKTITDVAKFACKKRFIESLENSIYFHSITEVSGDVYAIASVPDTGLCLIQINGDEDYTIVKILFEGSEYTWNTFPWYIEVPTNNTGELFENTQEKAECIFSSADLSVHGNNLLICASKQTKGCSVTDFNNGYGTWESTHPFIFEPFINIEHIVGVYDTTSSLFTEINLPMARLMPNINNQMGFSGVGSNINTNGIRPTEINIIPRSLRYNVQSDKYDLFGIILDISLSGTPLASIKNIGDTAYFENSFKYSGFYCQFDSEFDFIQGKVQRKSFLQNCPVDDLDLDNQDNAVYNTMKSDIEYISRDRGHRGDCYISGELPLFVFKNKFEPGDNLNETLHFIAQSIGSEYFSYIASISFMATDIMYGFCKEFNQAYSNILSTILYNDWRIVKTEPSLGSVVGFRTRYNSGDDSYDIELITSDKINTVNDCGEIPFLYSRYMSLFGILDNQVIPISIYEGAQGVELGNGQYSFDKFIPDFSLHEGDTTLCPITVNLHTNAITFFDN